MTYAELLERIINDGIAAARADYKDPDKLRGSVDGFEACRGKTPQELVELRARADQEASTRHGAADYWYWRCRVLEIEWTMNVISVDLPRPLLQHLPTARGVMKYAKIVGVRDDLAVLS